MRFYFLYSPPSPKSRYCNGWIFLSQIVFTLLQTVQRKTHFLGGNPMKAKTLAIAAGIFGIFIWSTDGHTGSRDRKPPPKYTVVCSCFAQTVDNPRMDYFGHVFGWGETELEADANANFRCSQKTSILRAGGATRFFAERCATI